MSLSNDRRRSYTVLWSAFLLCLFPLLLLSFFNIMSTDDLILLKSLQDRGLFPTQSYMFGWTGRYTAIFIESLLMEAGASRWYFVHTWLLLAVNWGAFYYVLVTVNTRLLTGLYSRRLLLLGAAVLLLLFFYIQAEIATSLYWFSAAIPYQLAFVLFLFLAACLIRRFLPSAIGLPVPSARPVSVPSRSRRYDLAIVLLILLIAGCNEIAAVFQIFLLLTLLAIAWRSTRSVNRSLLFFNLMAIAVGFFIVRFSGLFPFRYKILRSNAGYITVLPIIFFRAFTVFYCILKLPLFWVASLVLYLAGKKAAVDMDALLPSGTTRPRDGKKLLISGFFIISGLMLSTLSAITLVTRGPLPQRALNNLIDLTAFGLLALFFTIGAVHKPTRQTSGEDIRAKIHPLVLPALLICTLVAADPFADAWSSCFSGYFYSAAEKAREHQIRAAASSRQKTVELPPFQQSLDQEVRQVFPHGTFATVQDWLQTSPALLYFAGHTEDDCRSYGIYCGLDTVIIQKNR